MVCAGDHLGRGWAGRAGRGGRGGDAGPSGFYDLTDVMFSVRAITDSAGLLHTRLDYTPYGVAMHGLAADANGDGSVNTADLGVVSANYNGGNELQPGDTGYDPDAFLDGSDTIVLSDYTGRYSPYVSGGSGPTFNTGWIDNPGDANGPDNSVGYDGYWFDLAGATEATSSGLYMVRHRVYDPRLGRWLHRDPAGYVDGSNHFEYTTSSPSIGTDPTGLKLHVVAIDGWGTSETGLAISLASIKYDHTVGQAVQPYVAREDWHWFSNQNWRSDRTKLESLLNKVERQSQCNADEVILIGFSNGGHRAHTISHAMDASRFDPISLVMTLDPVPAGLLPGASSLLSNPTYSKSQSAIQWINFYQRESHPKGWPVAGASPNHQLRETGINGPFGSVLALIDPMLGMSWTVRVHSVLEQGFIKSHVSVTVHAQVIAEWHSRVRGIYHDHMEN